MSLPPTPVIDGDGSSNKELQAAGPDRPPATQPGTLPPKPSVSFEEYLYYADITRKEEEAANALYLAARGPTTFSNLISNPFSKRPTPSLPPSTTGDAAANEKAAARVVAAKSDGLDGKDGDIIVGVSPDEWKQASRAMRTASWGGVFYLITTDILGPFSTPSVLCNTDRAHCMAGTRVANQRTDGPLRRWATAPVSPCTPSLASCRTSMFASGQLRLGPRGTNGSF